MPIKRNSFIQMSKLSNTKGRINYISSKARQKISMQSMKLRRGNSGENLQSAIKRNLRKVVQTENVLRQEN